MIIKKPDTDFDQLIPDAKHKFTPNSAKNFKIHRPNSHPEVSIGQPAPLNFTAFFERADASDSHQPPESNLITEPTSPDSTPSHPSKHAESLGDKRWKYQGKTYKEESIGRS